MIPLAPNKLKAAGFGLAHHDVVIPLGPEPVAFEDVLEPEFWSNVAPRMNLHDTVDVIAEDGSFDATLRVVEIEKAGSAWARMRVLRKWETEM